VLAGAVSGAQQFVTVLATTGDLGAALEIGYGTFRNSVTSAVDELVSTVQATRTQVYNDLTANAPALGAAAIPVAQAVVLEPQADAETETPPAPARTPLRAAAAVSTPIPVTAGTTVGEAARDALGEARAAGTQVGKAVEDAVGSAKRARPAAARSAR
jgi:hypothetical protein